MSGNAGPQSACVLLFVLIDVNASLKEHRLAKGLPAYQAYAGHTPRVIPGLSRR
jgi:protein-S-isoprenylcysteine O-methyltransferase Ste14